MSTETLLDEALSNVTKKKNYSQCPTHIASYKFFQTKIYHYVVAALNKNSKPSYARPNFCQVCSEAHITINYY